MSRNRNPTGVLKIKKKNWTLKAALECAIVIGASLLRGGEGGESNWWRSIENLCVCSVGGKLTSKWLARRLKRDWPQNWWCSARGQNKFWPSRFCKKGCFMLRCRALKIGVAQRCLKVRNDPQKLRWESDLFFGKNGREHGNSRVYELSQNWNWA